MNRDVPEGGFNIQFGHKTVVTKILEYSNRIIYFNVLERTALGGDVGVDASEVVFGLG